MKGLGKWIVGEDNLFAGQEQVNRAGKGQERINDYGHELVT